MDKYLYYPGCSMEGSAKAYHESLMAVCGPLGLNLEEIADWNCCGATEYLGVSLTPAYALIARNLALAVQSVQWQPQPSSRRAARATSIWPSAITTCRNGQR